jgi:signal transduction histidine kinase
MALPETSRALHDDVLAVADQLKQTLANDLHDHVAQALTTMLVELETFKAEQKGRAGVLRQVESLQHTTRGVLRRLRELLNGLHGEASTYLTFLEDVSALLSWFEQTTGIATALVTTSFWPRDLSPVAGVNLFRIIQEALSNAARHSGATRVTVKLEADLDSALVEVTDNGRGIDALRQLGPRGMGMMSMRERALMVGGELTVVTPATGGVAVRVRLNRAALDPIQDTAKDAVS